MIALIGASAIYLTALQAVINGPRDAFKNCLKAASEKAATEKVTADGYQAYVREACGTQLGSFKGAVIKFDMNNKMSRKSSDEDANLMIADFMDSALDRYKYVIGSDPLSKQQQATAAPPAGAKPQPTPAAVAQPAKP
jgi:hypothetical protein